LILATTQFPFQILSPERVIYEGDIVSLVAPGTEGYLGVMARHAPMIAALGAGEVKITAPDGILRFAISGGVLEVEPGQVVLLADTAERAEKIDVARAQAARERAAERLLRRDPEIDAERAHAALIRAMTRLRVAEHHTQQ
jgi:F-type H+-transporting ATPase subunit epsilon